MMGQSMRSGTIVAPGEKQGCVGCHENRVEDTPPPTKAPLAVKREPSKLTGWRGKQELFSYMEQVQPIFDRHCVECHDFGKPAGRKLVLAGDRTVSFNASYIDLWSRKYLTCADAGPAAHFESRTWGSHPSKLIKVVREGHEEHKELKLSAEELETLITWVDLNAPYYPAYECAYPNNPCGRSPITGAQLNQLGSLTKARFVLHNGDNQRAQICFERPGMSPGLQR